MLNANIWNLYVVSRKDVYTITNIKRLTSFYNTSSKACINKNANYLNFIISTTIDFEWLMYDCFTIKISKFFSAMIHTPESFYFQYLYRNEILIARVVFSTIINTSSYFVDFL